MSWDVTACTASLQHLCAVAVDRYFAINDPLHYYERMSSRKVIVIVAVIWLNSSCISFLPIFLDWYSDNSESTNVMNGQCFLDINKPYAVISASISFYIPLAIMGGCYYKIFSIAMKQAKEIYRMQKSLQHNNPDDTQSLTSKSNNLASERKAIRTLGIIFGMFYLCWQPFFIIYWIYAFSPHPDIPNWVRSSITWLGYINSAMNPAIYALNPDFRAAYKKIAWMLIKKCPGGSALKDRQNSLYGAPYEQRNSSPVTIPDMEASNELPRDRPSPHTMRNYSSIGVTDIARITYVNGHHPSKSSLHTSPLVQTVSNMP
ncbi:hypothetical protein RvY_05720-2 [Ramazzottius varieornatus]|nr:hypothetical protein RvY_05720-2 [Ramazzottius varieornatus]